MPMGTSVHLGTGAQRRLALAGNAYRPHAGSRYVGSVTPSISVVVPTRNRYLLLRSVLNALARQRDMRSAAIEVVVVADGCSDKTVADLARWRPPFRLTVLAQPHRGVSAARNRGWIEAKADLILFLDDDMVPDGGLLAEHVCAHQGVENAVVLGRVEQVSPAADAWTEYDGWTMRRKYAGLEADREVPSGIHFGGNFSISRRLLEDVGGFDSRLPRGQHVDLGFRLAERGANFRYAARARVEHRGHRDLERWKVAYRLDGRMDVALYGERGHAGGLASIVASYHDRHWLNRGLLRVALRRRFLESGLIDATVGAGILARRMRILPLSHIALSACANLLYWGGVRDGMRGNGAFWQAIGRTRLLTERAYRLRRHVT